MKNRPHEVEPPPPGPRHSIRNRLLRWTTGVTGCLLIAVIAWNYLSVRDRLEAEAKNRATFLAAGSADKIDAKLGQLQGLVRGIALTLETQAFAVSFETVRALQNAALRDYPEIYGTAIALLPSMKPATWPDVAPWAYRNREVLEYHNLDGVDHPFLRDDWFTLPRYLDRGVWSEPYLWQNGVKMVTYSMPVHRMTATGREFAGVVTCDIALDWLDGFLAELPLGEQGYGLLMSRNGTYISHPSTELVLVESVFSVAEARGNRSFRETGQRMVSGLPGVVSWLNWRNGADSWLAWQPLKTADWTMGTVVSKAELRAEILRFSWHLALVGAIGLSLLVLAVWLVARSITRPIIALSTASGTLASGNLDASLPTSRGADEVAQLTSAFGMMRDSLKRYIAELAETTAARERMNSELRIAHDIQMDLLPKTFPKAPERTDIELFALMEAARQVGGDFYDFFFLDQDRLAIAIGDVAGKGIPAALFMGVTRSFLRFELRTDADPGRALARVSKELAEGNESCIFVTVFCAVVHLADGTVEYANAGHNAPLLARLDGRIEWIKKPHGIAAASLPDATYETGRFHLAIGETLLLFTDGVTEAMDPEHRLYGDERLASQFAAQVTGTCRDSLGALIGDIRDYAAGAEQSDDITMLMLRRLTPSVAEDQQTMHGCLQMDIANTMEALAASLDRLEAFIEREDGQPRLAYVARLVLEELVANTINYGYDDQEVHSIRVVFSIGPPASMRIEDDGHAFSPLADAPEPDLATPADERAIGGLGIHMARAMTASMDYQRNGNLNRLDIVFLPDSPRP